ncbi:hypothetical protein PLICRDRAFT_320446 [Plicaturopsis crispa FD-325 SS-3]|nr:hypothetical protein PLICRDRAFT_320446 [Plicaturopsis crispa FD-325 SS-3]
MPSTSSELPIELVVRIFHLAAASSSESCLALHLVSSWARDLAAPYLLSTVLLSPKKVLQFLHFLLSDPQQALGIRSLWLADLRCTKYMHFHILPNCSHVEHLAINGKTFDELFSMTLRECGLLDREFPADTRWQLTVMNTFPLMSSLLGASDRNRVINTFSQACHLWVVTHLDIDNLSEPGPVTKTRIDLILRFFRNLTHLKLRYYPRPGGAHAMGDLAADLGAEFARNLQMLVLAVEERDIHPETWVREVRRVDPRIFVDSPTTRRDWESAARGGENIWSKAVRKTQERLIGASE